MAIEKKGSTSDPDIRNLVQLADKEEKVIVLDWNGFAKYASTERSKEAVVVIATGPRAVELRKILDQVSGSPQQALGRLASLSGVSSLK